MSSSTSRPYIGLVKSVRLAALGSDGRQKSCDAISSISLGYTLGVHLAVAFDHGL